MNELTELEIRLMRTIPKECFYEHGFKSVLWNDVFLETLEDEEGISSKVARGILSSLHQKEFLIVDGGKDGSLSLNEKGKQWLLSNDLVDEKGYSKE